MADEKTCPHCGKPVPPTSLGGICPECMLKAGLATQTEGPGMTGPHGTKVVPPLPKPEEIAPLFPQLEILECLGRGGMGVVYKARQPRLNRLVALKILAREKEQDAQFAERFTREAQALARLSHPNIVTVHDFGETGGHCYLVMEFVDGLNLRQLLQVGKMKPEQALAIVPKICEALQYAHEQGIVHRDIKPENILMDKQGRVKIADFGIAKMLGTESGQQTLTGAKDTVGTPHYMAPEQIEKPLAVDHRADIYSLGVVFYEMLTGELPLGKFQPPSKKVQIDVRLDEVVLHALEKEPERRYQQASDIKTRIETIAQTKPVTGAAPNVAAFTQMALSGDYQLNIGHCLSRGWNLVAHDFWPIIGVVALIWLLQHAANSTLIGVVVAGPLSGGLWLYFLKKIRGQQADVGTAFSGFSVAFVQLFLGSLVTFLLVLAGLLCFLLPGIYLVVAWAFTLLLIADQGLDFGPAMRLSRKVISKHWWKFLWFLIVLGVIALAGLLFCFIGIFIAAPIAMAALAYAYEDIFGPAARAARNAPAGTPITPSPPERSAGTAVGIAVGTAAAVVVIAFLGLMTVIAIPNFIRARQYARALHEQQATVKSDHLGQTWFPQGDSIEITSVERTKNQMTVKGHYDLVSHNSALLALYITTPNKISVPVGSNETMQISKGRGEFELIDPYLVPGLPHISMYGADGHPFASVYFGTKAEALAESKASWITNQTTSNGGGSRGGGMGSSKAPEFGPTHEVILPALGDQTGILLDLDTGAWATNTEFGANDRETHAWICSHRVDVLGVIERGQIGILSMDMAVVPVPSNGWDSIKAEAVLTNWGLNQQEPHKITPLMTVLDHTDTWMFRTREDEHGVLQILGGSKNPTGVKIRYRLIQTQARSTEGTPSASSFYIGQTWFPQGDSIEITSVERTTNQMTVRGHYHLASHDNALLALYVTTMNKISVPVGPNERIQISKGRGEFELIDPYLVPGLPHVSMYGTDGHPFASVYFGTRTEALAESKASWITNQATSSRGGMGSSKVVKFGPVFDRVMVDSKIPFKSESVETNAMMMIDFDSGRLFSGSQKLWEANTDAQRRWMQTNGIDALCVVPQVGGLVGLDMKALPVPPQTWNETTSKILDQLRRSPRHETVLINARDSMPPTWLFQTREGSTGILQITGFTKNPRGVKIRYRLIQTQTRSSQTTPSASSFYIGQSWFPQGDSIEIASVERTTNQMTVKGHYDLVSRDQAELALYVTVTNKAFPGGSGEERPITKGRGDFTLVHLPPILGLPHVSMYGADGHCFASLYFGTKAEALTESKASWITNSPSAATETWSPTLAPGEKPDLQKILDSAQSLMDEGSYEESLQHFLWYFDHSRNDAGQRGVRLSFALSYWIELGRRYPKAKQALLEIRDNDLRQFSEGQGYAGLFQEIAALDQYLKDDQATLTLFKMIEQRDPELAQQCYIFAENLLVQNGDYQTCRKYLGDPQAAFERIRASWQRMKHFEEETAARNEAEKKRFQEMAKTNSLLAHIPFPLSSPPPFADQHFVNQTRQLIEILVATHDPAKAAKIQAEALAVVDDPGLRSAVSDAQQRIARHAAAAREQ